MSGRHEGPPVGSAAREATAPPYVGKRRTVFDADGNIPTDQPPYWVGPTTQDELDDWHELFGGPDDPPRCGSCGHVLADGCGCSCCPEEEGS